MKNKKHYTELIKNEAKRLGFISCGVSRAEFLEDEEIVRITNEEFVAINRNDLGGKYDIKLNISTAEADEQKGSELAFMLQTMGNTMPPEMSQMILADIAKLRKMPDLAFYNDDSLEYINKLEDAVQEKENPIIDTNLLDKRKKI